MIILWIHIRVHIGMDFGTETLCTRLGKPGRLPHQVLKKTMLLMLWQILMPMRLTGKTIRKHMIEKGPSQRKKIAQGQIKMYRLLLPINKSHLRNAWQHAKDCRLENFEAYLKVSDSYALMWKSLCPVPTLLIFLQIAVHRTVTHLHCRQWQLHPPHSPSPTRPFSQQLSLLSSFVPADANFMLLDNKKVDYGIVHKIQPFWFLKSYLDLVPRRGPGTRSGIKSRSGGPEMVAFARDSAAGEWGGTGLSLRLAAKGLQQSGQYHSSSWMSKEFPALNPAFGELTRTWIMISSGIWYPLITFSVFAYPGISLVITGYTMDKPNACLHSIGISFQFLGYTISGLHR